MLEEFGTPRTREEKVGSLIHLYVDGGLPRRELMRRLGRILGGSAAATQDGPDRKARKRRYAALTGFFRTPIPSISTSTISPGFIAPVVPGVPVKITSPCSSVTYLEMKLTQVAQS